MPVSTCPIVEEDRRSESGREEGGGVCSKRVVKVVVSHSRRESRQATLRRCFAALMDTLKKIAETGDL